LEPSSFLQVSWYRRVCYHFLLIIRGFFPFFSQFGGLRMKDCFNLLERGNQQSFVQWRMPPSGRIKDMGNNHPLQDQGCWPSERSGTPWKRSQHPSALHHLETLVMDVQEVSQFVNTETCPLKCAKARIRKRGCQSHIPGVYRSAFAAGESPLGGEEYRANSTSNLSYVSSWRRDLSLESRTKCWQLHQSDKIFRLVYSEYMYSTLK